MTWDISIERSIAVAPERVYDAWLNPEAMAFFLRPAPGVVCKDVEVDAQVGGRFALTMQVGTVEVPIHGQFTEMARPRRLVFSWHSARTRDDSVVTLTFTPDGVGTRFTLHHVGFVDASSHEDHDGGWQHIALQLDRWCAAEG